MLALATAIFTFNMTAYVPIICGAQDGRLFCNAPYVLYVQSASGRREIERSGPNIRDLEPLPDGEVYVVEPATPQP